MEHAPNLHLGQVRLLVIYKSLIPTYLWLTLTLRQSYDIGPWMAPFCTYTLEPRVYSKSREGECLTSTDSTEHSV